MDEMQIDLNALHGPSMLTAILITVYNRLADQDPELAQDLAQNLGSYRRKAPGRTVRLELVR